MSALAERPAPCYTSPVLASLLLAVLAVPAAALEIEHEEFKIIGWTDACSVAVERYAYPHLGEAMVSEPITTRVGTLTIELKTPVVITRWVFEADGANTYDRFAVERFRKKLRKAGYDRAGFFETVRDSETVVSPGSAEVILSTAVLDARPDFWPDTRQWRLGFVAYNPLSTCALLIYEDRELARRYKFTLTRIYNPSARADRGRAHTTNGRLLFNQGELEAALVETEIGARMAPEVGATRYHYGAMLALNGHPDAAMKELLAAVARDDRFADKAAKDVDFDSLRERQDFRELILREKTPPLPGAP